MNEKNKQVSLNSTTYNYSIGESPCHCYHLHYWIHGTKNNTILNIQHNTKRKRSVVVIGAKQVCVTKACGYEDT